MALITIRVTWYLWLKNRHLRPAKGLSRHLRRRHLRRRQRKAVAAIALITIRMSISPEILENTQAKLPGATREYLRRQRRPLLQRTTGPIAGEDRLHALTVPRPYRRRRSQDAVHRHHRASALHDLSGTRHGVLRRQPSLHGAGYTACVADGRGYCRCAQLKSKFRRFRPTIRSESRAASRRR